MRSDDPLRKRPAKSKPEIWVSGGQRPPFDLRALGTGTLHLAREGVAPLHAWAARTARRVAVKVKDGAGRLPVEKLGRAERFVPSHLRVAGWIKNVGATLAHASANADPDISRGNALVTEIEPHLWAETAPQPEAEPPVAAPQEPVAPVDLSEPKAEADPLASIRGELADKTSRTLPTHPAGPDSPPGPPGAVGTAVIQVTGYLIGWASVIIALPYGLARALWQWANGRDLKAIGRED
ncbi:MAG: hypothetical protein FD150_85 [Rhodobacteraceae bacterium]|nr:MAG: hypothetical protein FD150_85 [Paracoccaceae bacterium]